MYFTKTFYELIIVFCKVSKPAYLTITMICKLIYDL